MEGSFYLPALTICRIHPLTGTKRNNPEPDVNRKACPPYFWRLFRTGETILGSIVSPNAARRSGASDFPGRSVVWTLHAFRDGPPADLIPALECGFITEDVSDRIVGMLDHIRVGNRG